MERSIDQNLKANKGRNYFLYFATISANLLSFAVGSSLTWSSPALIKLNEDGGPLREKLTVYQQSWLVSLLSFGTAMSPPLAGMLSVKIGRKKTLIISGIPMLAGYIMIAVATELYQFYIGRLLCGISCGGLFSILPLYVGEIAENHNRGKLCCFLPLAMNVGSIFSFAVGPYVSMMTFGFASAIAPLLFLIVFTLLVPESPYYLLSQSDDEAARSSLRKLRRYYESKEFLEITDGFDRSSEQGSFNLKEILKNKALVKSTIITVGLYVLQQCSGLVVILMYSQTIFERTGSSISPEISSLLIGFVQLGGCVLAITVVDKIGRRVLLLWSSSGNALTLFTLGLYFYLESEGIDVEAFQWLPTATVIIYTIAFSVGIGPVPSTIFGEIFPSNAKSVASTLTCVVGFYTGFCVTLLFPPLMVSIGMAASFWIFAAMCVTSAIFVYAVVPETKGKSFQEIQDMLSR